MKSKVQKPQLHLAVFSPQFLDLIFNGKKTVESRFSKVKCAPFGFIKSGDRVLLKESGGLVKGEFVAEKVFSWSDPSQREISQIRSKYGDALGSWVDPGFWEKRSSSRYITLITIAELKKFDKPFTFPKRDRRGWVVLGTEPLTVP